jgi:hypothetical protein
MNAARRAAVGAVLGLVLVAVSAARVGAVRGADHGDSPQVRDDTRADINDVYVFASPETPANTVMVMTVCPLAGVTGPKLFAPGTKYEFVLSTDGDAVEDQVYSFTFKKPDATGKQAFALAGPRIGTTRVKAKGTTDTLGFVFEPGGKVFAGLRDDPFFFDLIGFKQGLAFSAESSRNFFRGLNTMAIVVEAPTSSFGTLAGSTLRLWARTKKGRFQIDRMGRPAINTVLIGGSAAGGNKDLFNRSSPKDDQAKWRTEMVTNLKVALGRTDEDANGLADILLPDVLTYDPTNDGGFLNGRKLTDDVIDAELGILSNNLVTTDFVADDNVFLPGFPYLAPPNP